MINCVFREFADHSYQLHNATTENDDDGDVGDSDDDSSAFATKINTIIS